MPAFTVITFPGEVTLHTTGTSPEKNDVVNKVEEIMSHYKTSQINEVLVLIKRFIKKIASI